MDPGSAPVRERTDRCPGVLRLHEAADGFLARVRLPGGRISSAGLRAVASVAANGNGIVELTSRASLQVRGLTADGGDAAAERLRAGGLLPSVAHDTVRNVLASPVAGRHPASLCATDAIVAALDRGLCDDERLASLPGRFLFAVDDGSGLAEPWRADVALVAEPDRFRLWLAGASTTLTATPLGAFALALRAALAFLGLRDEEGEVWRLQDVADGPASLARRLGGEVIPGTANAGPPLPAGTFAQADGLVAVTALPPLGRLDPGALQGLAGLTSEVRLSTARTLTIVDVPGDEAAARTAGLGALGLVTAQDSGWVGLSACAGLGACSRALIDVRAAATARAAQRRAQDPAEHWTACERGCGRPANALLVEAFGA